MNLNKTCSIITYPLPRRNLLSPAAFSPLFADLLLLPTLADASGGSCEGQGNLELGQVQLLEADSCPWHSCLRSINQSLDGLQKKMH